VTNYPIKPRPVAGFFVYRHLGLGAHIVMLFFEYTPSDEEE